MAALLVWAFGFWPSITFVEWMRVKLLDQGVYFLTGDVLTFGLAVLWVIGMVYLFDATKAQSGERADDVEEVPQFYIKMIITAPTLAIAASTNSDFVEYETTFSEVPFPGKRLMLEEEGGVYVLGLITDVTESLEFSVLETQYFVWVVLDNPEHYTRLAESENWESVRREAKDSPPAD